MTMQKLRYWARDPVAVWPVTGRRGLWQVVVHGRPVSPPLSAQEARVRAMQEGGVLVLVDAGFPADRARAAVIQAIEAGAELRIDRVTHAARRILLDCAPHSVRT